MPAAMTLLPSPAPRRLGMPAGGRHRAAALALLSCAAALPAQAQLYPGPTSYPYYIGVAQTFTRETNLVRAPDGIPAIGDTISSTTLLGGINRSIGRQRVYLNGSAQYNRYRENSIYDNTGYSLAGGVDWSTVGRVSGSVNATSSKQLATFGQLLSVYTPERNVINSDQFNAVARVGTVTPLTFEGTYTHQQLRYSADRFKFAQFSQDIGGLNLLWRSSALLTFGTGVRLIRGRYPQGPYGDDPFTGRGIDLSVNWTPSALSSLEGRVGYSRTQHEDVSRREFSGLTGNLVWNWQPTGKIRLTTQLTRATGQDASFISFVSGSSTANSSLSQVTNTLAFFGRYAATARIGLEGNLRVSQRQLDRTVAAAAAGTASNDSGSDTTRVLGLTARYDATRSLQLSCNIGREQRTTSSALSYAYRANYGGCSAQFTLFP